MIPTYLKYLVLFPLIILLYWLPGYWILRHLCFEERRNFLFSIFLSIAIWPAVAVFLTLFYLNKWWPIYISLAFTFCIPPIIKKYVPVSQLEINTSVSRVEKTTIIVIACLIVFITAICRLWTLDGHLSNIWDDFFHVSKFLGIVDNGIPASFFRNPNMPLRYAYIYYIPAASLVCLSRNIITCDLAWFIHCILSNLAAFGALLWASKRMFPKINLALVSIGFFFSSFGIEWLPFLLTRNEWTVGLNFGVPGNVGGLLFEDIFVVLQWVPQHVFGASTAIVILTLLVLQIKKYSPVLSFIIAVLVLDMIGSGPFGAMALVFSGAIWFIIELLINSKKGTNPYLLSSVLKTSFLSIVLSLPVVFLYLPMKNMLAVQAPIFQELPQNLFGWALSTLIHMCIEYHLWIVGPFYYFGRRIFDTNNIPPRILVAVFIGITIWTHTFVQDYPTFNNISNRPSIILFMLDAILSGAALSDLDRRLFLKLKWHHYCASVFFICLAISGIGAHLYGGWKYSVPSKAGETQEIPSWLRKIDIEMPLGTAIIQGDNSVYMGDLIFTHRVSYQKAETFSHIDRHLVANEDIAEYGNFKLDYENRNSLRKSPTKTFGNEHFKKPVLIVSSSPCMDALDWQRVDSLIDISWNAFIERKQIKKQTRWIAQLKFDKESN